MNLATVLAGKKSKEKRTKKYRLLVDIVYDPPSYPKGAIIEGWMNYNDGYGEVFHHRFGPGVYDILTFTGPSTQLELVDEEYEEFLEALKNDDKDKIVEMAKVLTKHIKPKEIEYKDTTLARFEEL
jgi:hypothetical protein